MSGDDRLTREELAIDYALGLAEGAALERAERLEATDAVFRALVEDWRRQLAALDETAPERPVAGDGWRRLELALDAPATAPARVDSKPEGLLASLWRSIGFWRPAAMAAAFAAIVLAVGLARHIAAGPDKPVYVAVLQTGDGRAAAVVNAYADGTVNLVPLEQIGVPEGRILEVWTLQSREQGPVSIGRMDRARTLKLDLARLRRPDAGHLFEITVEPPGGSPTGRPTGPILMKGLASQAL
ncbi:MAG: anti-sigma factor [Beijerinckiaceae bacterium]